MCCLKMYPDVTMEYDAFIKDQHLQVILEAALVKYQLNKMHTKECDHASAAQATKMYIINNVSAKGSTNITSIKDFTTFRIYAYSESYEICCTTQRYQTSIFAKKNKRRR